MIRINSKRVLYKLVCPCKKEFFCHNKHQKHCSKKCSCVYGKNGFQKGHKNYISKEALKKRGNSIKKSWTEKRKFLWKKERKEYWTDERKKSFSLFAKKHKFGMWMLGRKHDQETISKMKDGRRKGINNSGWKGKTVSYSGLHKWLAREFGKATKCENREKKILSFVCRNIDNKYQWANKSKKYKRDINDFLQLCTSCHCRYDIKRKTKDAGRCIFPETTLKNVSELRKQLKI